MQKIAFFTEMQFIGKIPRNHENMRTEFAWMCTLEADHYNIHQLPKSYYKGEEIEYDLGIIIIPKKDPNFNISQFKKCCKKVAVMQEGPNWYWQDYALDKQIWYNNILLEADIIFTHNQLDKKYYQGLTNHPDVRVLSSLMIEEAIGELPKVERKGVIIGGNFCSWYGGFDSFRIAEEFGCDKIYLPSMGRKIEGEEQIQELSHLPYMNWKQWIHKLNEFKYGVHLMRTHAAGTFALNCAYLGIPCIGYKGLDTQEILHPSLTVELGDLKKARYLAKLLKENEFFYSDSSKECKELYNKHYKEEQFLKNFSFI